MDLSWRLRNGGDPTSQSDETCSRAVLFYREVAILVVPEGTRTNYPEPGAGQLLATAHLLAAESQLVTATCDGSSEPLSRTAQVEAGFVELGSPGGI